ncbi:MAG: AAA family ATPase [Flavobacteriales bacterium]|nr:AAA family ATPase [Flavobacteriales bacterium]
MKNQNNGTIIIFMGIPGSGKSTLAELLVDKNPLFRIVSRDTIRDAMFRHCDYTVAEKNAAYKSVKIAASVILKKQENVVLDGMCWSSYGALEDIMTFAEDNNSRTAVFYCSCSSEVAINRVELDALNGVHLAKDRNADLVRRVGKSFRDIPNFVTHLNSELDPHGNIKIIQTKINELLC